MSDFVEGNYEDKYNAKNPISKYLMSNFLSTFTELLNSIPDKNSVKTICEVGVGEGELIKIVHQLFPKAALYATDLSKNEINKAKKNLKNINVNFSNQNAEGLKEYKTDQFDLVVCCEVLEHTQNPAQALSELKRISKKHIIVSVPNEPIWRILNMLRGKYLANFGNTPGHLNHWGILSFKKYLNHGELKTILERYPFPWQMKLVLSPD